MFISLQSVIMMYGLYKKIKIEDAYPKKVCHMPTRHVKKKERKDAYPKKVCHMPTRRVKKKRRKRKYSPYQKKIYKGKNSYEGVSSTIHQKYPHTCTSWSRLMTCFSFRSGLWLSEIWEASLPLHPPYLQIHQKEPLEVGWKRKAHKKALVRNKTHLSDPRDHPRNLQKFFSKTL